MWQRKSNAKTEHRKSSDQIKCVLFTQHASRSYFFLHCMPQSNWCLVKSSLYTATQHSTAQHSTAQHSTAQHSTAQHSTAQHSTAQDISVSSMTTYSVMLNGSCCARCMKPQPDLGQVAHEKLTWTLLIMRSLCAELHSCGYHERQATAI